MDGAERDAEKGPRSGGPPCNLPQHGLWARDGRKESSAVSTGLCVSGPYFMVRWTVGG